ncbi:hypothetical protein PR202_gb01560 [Eleusine coracana subsp. coracana]|uniref:DUF1618 domain-containing protein n=1 Tax=Eleusine coracana subsp. coracana TaxID=191504 RepID=A0AAV5DWD6_ELECO|nr:hypothetical protein QOZ80_5BG0417130 [Eleusine coracana subsp. coracana]GJN14705.1 hypothetical protein PR202_gb01560 [Eleusine coracana subsp. coracana]
MAPASPSWVILDTIPRVSAGEPRRGNAAISLDLAAPPRVTRLTAGPTIFPIDPDTKAGVPYPCILAADPASGLLLAIAPPSISERAPASPRVWRGPDGAERVVHVGRIPDPAYLVLDLPSAAASRVPDPDVLNASSLGVIAAPTTTGAGGYMVAEFQNMVGSHDAELVCFSSDTGEWVEKEVANPLPSWIWTFDDVVAHDGRLWWVDTAAGLLACDPFADKPDMAYVPLPKAGGGKRYRGCGYCAERTAASRRCVKLSGGKFRCVEMGLPCGSKVGGAPKITMRTLEDPKTALWTLEYQVSFAEIWASESYKAAGLPEKAPVVALVHPKNPDVVYFFLGEYIFGVDVPARKVVECAAHDLDVPASEGGASSLSVLAWELPPTLTAGSATLQFPVFPV